MRYKKVFFFSLSLLVFGLLVLSASTMASATTTDDVSAAGATTTASEEPLELPDPGITPTSPFYFLDRFGDWLKLNLTFNPVKRARVKAEILEERLSEMNKLSEEGNEEEVQGLEQEIEEGVNELHQKAEELDKEDKPLAPVLEKIEKLSLKRQRVLERILDKVPENAKPAIEKAIERGIEFAKKRRQILMRQKAKGLIDEEKAKEIIENRLEKIKDHLEAQKEKLDKIDDPEKREMLKSIIDKRLEALEDDILAVESSDSLKDVAQKIAPMRKKIAMDVLRLRRHFLLPTATSTEEFLSDLAEGKKVDFQERAKELLEKAKRGIEEVEKKLSGLPEGAAGDIRTAVERLLQNAKAHLDKGKEAYDSGKYREAFGHLMAAVRNINNALRILEKAKMVKEIISGGNFDASEIYQKYARVREEVKPYLDKLPQEVRELLVKADREIELLKKSIEEKRFIEAHRHYKIVRQIIDRLVRFLEMVKGDRSLLKKKPAEIKNLFREKMERVKEMEKEKMEGRRLKMFRNLPSGIFKPVRTAGCKFIRVCPKEAVSAQARAKCEVKKVCPEEIESNEADEMEGREGKFHKREPERIRWLKKKLEGGLEEEEGKVFCTQEYKPVCGVDGTTYSNRCVAEKIKKVEVKHEGRCRVFEKKETKPLPFIKKRLNNSSSNGEGE